MSKVIELTKMDAKKILINVASIETVESNPDTIIILSSGRKLLVRESTTEIYKIING